ncbi:pyridoxal-phosphate dependent enzyme [Candidatus Vidania fulgoroideorum]
MKMPNKYGYFGKFGGMYVNNELYKELIIILNIFFKCSKNMYYNFLKIYSIKPTPIYFAKKISKKTKNKIFFKREDINFTGSHKINNVIGQILLAKYLNKNIVIAETGAGQHGYAVASICASFNIKCIIFMGNKDYYKQKKNVFKIISLGANLKKVGFKNDSLINAINESIRFWNNNKNSTYYLVGSVVGPHPFPFIIRNFQKIIGYESIMQKYIFKKIPNYILACVGGGSNSIGLFYEFLKNGIKTNFIGLEAGGVNKINNSSSLNYGKKGILHGCKTIILNSNFSISSGLRYPGVGPEHAYLNYYNKVNYKSIRDKEALKAFKQCFKLEGILPSIETSHAIYYSFNISCNKIILINFSGKGEKDKFI